MSVIPVYERLCPSCGGFAEADYVEKYGLCSRCFARSKGNYLDALSYIKSLEEEIKAFEDFFSKATGGFKLWGNQRSWIRRLLRHENTSIIAPTGIGKTTLLISYALYMASRYSLKILFLTPTLSLAKQIYSKACVMRDRSEAYSVKILFYDSTLRREERNNIIENIINDEYDILILTNAFLSRKYGVLKDKKFDIIIVDDVDSILNRSRNILRLLYILGFDDEDIYLAKRIVDLRSKVLIYKINGLEDLYVSTLDEYCKLEARLHEKLSRKRLGQIIISSATGRAKGPYIPIFRELLNIDVSGIVVYARDVTDSYKLVDTHMDVISALMKLLSKLGPGGIILVSPFHPLKKYIDHSTIVNILKEAGYKAKIATPKTVKEFIDGNLDMIVGSSTYYGVSVRGIDAPEKIKYVVFIGTPCFSTDLDNMLCSVKGLYRILLFLRDEGIDVKDHINALARILRYASVREVKLIKDLLKGKIDLDSMKNDRVLEKYNIVKSIIDSVRPIIESIVASRRVVRLGSIVLYYDGSCVKALVPDVMTYIQASGRSSRLYKGRMTHGLSIIIELRELKELLKAMELRFRRYNRSITFNDIDQIDLGEENRLITETRLGRGREFSVKYRSILLVVESPTKARTIASFYGKPARRRIGNVVVYEIPVVKGNDIIHFSIVATKGHIFDITTADEGIYGIAYTGDKYLPIFKTIKRCRICKHQFTDGDRCPKCGSIQISDSIEIVSVLRKLASEVDEILIATDPDMEGEKIAYDVYLIVKPFNSNIYRIELHEITPMELERALKRKRRINMKLVNAQLYRRILDRLIGFSLSQDLWKVFNMNWLGAGRVQTPVLGWIIDSYYKWKSDLGYKIIVIVGQEPPLKITLFTKDRDKANEIAKLLMDRGYIILEPLTKVVIEDRPKPPYTTDELLSDASRIGIPSNIAMKLAQELFESGLITYHRTDSTYVSDVGRDIARRYIRSKYGVEYFTPRQWGQQGTHEAIRPTSPWDPVDVEKAFSEGLLNIPIFLTPLHMRIYELIFNRFIASQMKPYKMLVIKARARLLDDLELIVDVPIRIVEHGYDLVIEPKVYTWVDVDNASEYSIESVIVKRASQSRLYKEGDVVRLMKERGIGRPSTYATILKLIRKHGYVIMSKKRGYLIPTKTGINVYNYLNKKYGMLVSEDMTRNMERAIDNIVNGTVDIYDAVNSIMLKLQELNLINIDMHKATIREAYISISTSS